jgi:hypothetical protein
MTPDQIRAKVARTASKLTAGGFRPTGEISESWLCKVFLFGPDEGMPLNSAGELLLPLAQIYLEGLPAIPECLEGIELVTAFIGASLPGEFEPMGEKWLVREYASLADVARKELPQPESFLKAFPVSSERFDNDWPAWDGGGLDEEMTDEILALEDSGVIGDYYDIAEHEYGHKVGGYPSFCQPGVDAGPGFEFAFQVSSDQKINLNVVDNGSLQFYRNPQTREWKIYYDFY